MWPATPTLYDPRSHILYPPFSSSPFWCLLPFYFFFSLPRRMGPSATTKQYNSLRRKPTYYTTGPRACRTSPLYYAYYSYFASISKKSIHYPLVIAPTLFYPINQINCAYTHTKYLIFTTLSTPP